MLNAGFLGYAIALLNNRNERLAMDMFNYSILYLMALFAILLVDHYLKILGKNPGTFMTATESNRSLRALEDRAEFIGRHIGPRDDEIQQMLAHLGWTRWMR